MYKRIKEENNKIGEARAINSSLSFFKDTFIMPVNGVISGVYGSQRILNGIPKGRAPVISEERMAQDLGQQRFAGPQWRNTKETSSTKKKIHQTF